MDDFEFWRRETFWPAGAVVNRWKGSTETNRQSFFKRIQITGIPSGKTTSDAENYFRKLYRGIDFKNLCCDEIVRGKMVLSIELDSRKFKNFMATGLSSKQWPTGVGVKFLKNSLIGSRNVSWDLEVVRADKNDDEKLMDVTTEDLEIPVEEISTALFSRKRSGEKNGFRFWRFSGRKRKRRKNRQRSHGSHDACFQ